MSCFHLWIILFGLGFTYGVYLQYYLVWETLRLTYSHAVFSFKSSKAGDSEQEQKGECGFRLLKYEANSSFVVWQRQRIKVVTWICCELLVSWPVLQILLNVWMRGTFKILGVYDYSMVAEFGNKRPPKNPNQTKKNFLASSRPCWEWVENFLSKHLLSENWTFK